MEDPLNLFIVTESRGFKSPTGSFDVFDCPYNCRGITQMGRRCSRTIAESRVASLPSYTGKGIVAFWRPTNSYRNRLAAYYCWQHTFQAEFRPVKRSSTHESQPQATEQTTRRPLGAKSANTRIRVLADSGERVKVEEVEEVKEVEEVVSHCRVSAKPPRPITISTAVLGSPVEKVRSPNTAVKRTTDTSRETSAKKEATIKKEDQQTDSKTLAESQMNVQPPRKADTAKDKEADLEVVNTRLLAAISKLIRQVENLNTKVAILEADKTVVVSAQIPAQTSTLQLDAGTQTTILAPVAPGTGSNEAPAGPPEPSKRPNMVVEPVEIEENAQEKGQSPTWKSKVRNASEACCGCM